MDQKPSSALWQLSFRPFFLLASAFAALAMLLWLAVFFGLLPHRGSFDPITWHAHEMLYGFTSAVIAGFVLTAAQNWTGIRGVHGLKLQLLVLLWVAGRVAITFVPGPSILATVLDLAFYPALAALMFPYLRDPELKVERVFFLYFALYLAGNLLIHLNAHGIAQGLSRTGLLLGVHTTTAMLVFMGGRVIPFFTESSIARAQPRENARVEVASHVSMWAFLVSATLLPASVVTAVIGFVAAGVHLVRLRGWYVRRVRRVPLIWVLHVSYAWLAVGFALTGLAALGVVAASPALHAFTVGGIGVMTHGMMSRVGLGHTGRRLHPSAWTVVGYVCLNLGAVARVFGVLVPQVYPWAVQASGVLWVGAFGVFVGTYLPMLVAPRPDGRMG